jgi:uncharacterized protein YpmB
MVKISNTLSVLGKYNKVSLGKYYEQPTIEVSYIFKDSDFNYYYNYNIILISLLLQQELKKITCSNIE